MRALAPLVLVGCGILGGSSRALAEDGAVEVDVFGGLTQQIGPAVPNAVSTTNGGLAVALTIQYRSPYFLAPFVDFAHSPILASDRTVELGAGRTLVTNRLSLFGLTGGAALEVWRLRARVGLGAYWLVVGTRATEVSSTASELDFGYVASLAAYPWVQDGLRVGIEVRAGLVVEAEIRFISVGATLGGDLVTF